MRAVVGLGANLGRPVETFGAVLELLKRRAVLRSASHVYLSPAQGFIHQPPFANAAVAIEWAGTPDALLDCLQSIERRLGRRRARRFGPRIIDLDLLWIDGVAIERRDLSVPHPFLLQRAFALLPLLEVEPDARDPRSGRPYTKEQAWLRGQCLRKTPQRMAVAPSGTLAA